MCKKIKYRDKIAAMFALAKCRYSSKGKRQETREYNDELSIRFGGNYTFIEYANLCFNPEDVTETNLAVVWSFPTRYTYTRYRTFGIY